MDLGCCLNACRAAELSKERRKALEESEVINTLRHKLDKRKWNQSTEVARKPNETLNNNTSNDFKKSVKECKSCVQSHERQKCPALGKKCLRCSKMNHFAKKCFSKSSRVNNIASQSSSSHNDRFEDDEYCLVINSDIQYKTISNYTISIDEKTQESKKLFSAFEFHGKSVKFQLDSGATCNVIPFDLPVSKRNLKTTRKFLKMYNNVIVKPLGQCKLTLKNLSNSNIYVDGFLQY